MKFILLIFSKYLLVITIPITGLGSIDRSVQLLSIPTVSGPNLGLTTDISPPYLNSNFVVTFSQSNNTGLLPAPSIYSQTLDSFTYNVPTGASYNVVINKTSSPLSYSADPPNISLPTIPTIKLR